MTPEMDGSPHEHRVTSWIPSCAMTRSELERVMAESRVGKRNRALITETYDCIRSSWDAQRNEADYWHRKYRDVVKSLKDRDQHIRNLEAIERERMGVG